MGHPRACRPPPGNDGDPPHNVLGITIMVDGHPDDHCNLTHHLQLSRPMDYRTPPQRQNDEPHHTITTPANGGVPGQPIPAIRHLTSLPPPTPRSGPATSPIRNPPQPPRTPLPLALSKHLVQGKLENRTTTSTADGTNVLPSPNPDKTTTPQQLHEEWLHTLPNHTVVIYTDGSKLENGSVGCGWATFHCSDQQLYRLGEGSCHLGNRAEVYDAELHAIQEAVTSLLTTTAL